AQVHFIGNNQLRIGEENLDDILEPNTVMMAFFARDEPEIVGTLYTEGRHSTSYHNLLK
ncbi:hypothetical protein LOAG_15876, partial [Loa loa]